MQKKNGFIAISLIYSFFLVFLMIMLSSSIKNAETRLMLQAIKDDIKANLNNESEFIITTLPEKNPITNEDYKNGDEINFVGESWLIIENRENTVVLILKRALNKEEITSSLEIESNNTDYFNNSCNESSCKIRMCMPTYYSNLCFYQSPTNYEYYKWENSVAKKVLESWFESNTNLQKACRLQFDSSLGKRVCSKDTITLMTFQDNLVENQDYIRLATEQEALLGSSTWVPNNGGYLSTESWSLTHHSYSNGKSYIYTNKREIIESLEVRTLRPVIEVKKS